MRYTSKKITGLLVMLLGVMLISRFSPEWLFFPVLAITAIFTLFVVYYYSSY